MFRKLLAITVFTLSVGANAATINYTMTSSNGLSGSFTWDSTSTLFTNVNLIANAPTLTTPLAILELNKGVAANKYRSLKLENHYRFTLFTDTTGGGLELLKATLKDTDISGSAGRLQRYDNVLATPVSNVPLPAAAWLFASALAGLIVTKRKKHQVEKASC